MHKEVRCESCAHFVAEQWEVVNRLPKVTARNVCDYWGKEVNPHGYCYMVQRKDKRDKEHDNS